VSSRRYAGASGQAAAQALRSLPKRFNHSSSHLPQLPDTGAPVFPGWIAKARQAHLGAAWLTLWSARRTGLSRTWNECARLSAQIRATVSLCTATRSVCSCKAS
jgi:hypothetical protein